MINILFKKKKDSVYIKLESPYASFIQVVNQIGLSFHANLKNDFIDIPAKKRVIKIFNINTCMIVS